MHIINLYDHIDLYLRLMQVDSGPSGCPGHFVTLQNWVMYMSALVLQAAVDHQSSSKKKWAAITDA